MPVLAAMPPAPPASSTTRATPSSSVRRIEASAEVLRFCFTVLFLIWINGEMLKVWGKRGLGGRDLQRCRGLGRTGGQRRLSVADRPEDFFLWAEGTDAPAFHHHHIID